MVLWGNRVRDFHIFVIQRKEIVRFKELAGKLIGNELNWIVERLGNEHLPCGLVGICMSAGLIDNASRNGLTLAGEPTEEEVGLWVGEQPGDLDTLANARRSRRWTSLSLKPSCRPRES